MEGKVCMHAAGSDKATSRVQCNGAHVYATVYFKMKLMPPTFENSLRIGSSSLRGPHFS